MAMCKPMSYTTDAMVHSVVQTQGLLGSIAQFQSKTDLEFIDQKILEIFYLVSEIDKLLTPRWPAICLSFSEFVFMLLKAHYATSGISSLFSWF